MNDIEDWRQSLDGLSNRSKNKLLIQMHGIFRRAQHVDGLETNPLSRIEKHPLRPSGDIDVFSPEEVLALVRAAVSEADAAIFLTTSFTGLRLGELLALHWREVDFTNATIRVRASYALGAVTTPKSGKVRAVPMAPDVAQALSRLGQREHWTGEGDLVFAGQAGGYLDGSALRRRYKAALAATGLRSLPFHDLRHTFGTRMIAKADVRRVQEWMGHADIQTTMKYLHYAPRADDARLVAEAFATDDFAENAADDLGRLGTTSGTAGDVSGTFGDVSTACVPCGPLLELGFGDSARPHDGALDGPRPDQGTAARYLQVRCRGRGRGRSRQARPQRSGCGLARPVRATRDCLQLSGR
jgi:integrase